MAPSCRCEPRSCRSLGCFALALECVCAGRIDWSDTGGWFSNSSAHRDCHTEDGDGCGTGYTRVEVTLSPGLVSYTKASLASCGGTAAASCHGEIRPYCDHAPCNATQVGHKRFNVSEDNRTFSVDLAIADAIILR